MNTQVTEIITKLLKHDLTKRQAIEQLSKLVPQQQTELPVKSKQTLQERKEAFWLSLINEFRQVYSHHVLKAFHDYWSEPNKSGTKMKWELQKTWSLKGRSSTWAKKAKNFEAKFQDKNGKSVMQQLNDL